MKRTSLLTAGALLASIAFLQGSPTGAGSPPVQTNPNYGYSAPSPNATKSATTKITSVVPSSVSRTITRPSPSGPITATVTVTTLRVTTVYTDPGTGQSYTRTGQAFGGVSVSNVHH